MRIKCAYITLILLLLVNSHVYSQEKCLETLIDFRVNDTQVNLEYKDNDIKISELISFLDKLQSDSTLKIINVSFCGATSPEGSHEWNKMLAKKRLESLEEIVRSRIPISDSLITRNDDYIPWTHLAKMVEESDISHKAEILNIINRKSEIVKYYGNRTIDYRVIRLMTLNKGKVWREMNRCFFGLMRNACVVFVTFKKIDLPAINSVATGADVICSMALSTPVLPIEPFDEYPLVQPWRRRLTVKTNLLGLDLAIANATVEVDLCRHWSFSLPLYYSAWDYFSSTVKFRTLAVQPEVRYWWSAKNDGWFTGAHLGLAYYNMATDGELRTQDHDGSSPALGGGFSVGYRMPVSRDNRWKLELSIGAGVYKLHYDKYRNSSDGLLVSTGKKTYIGIDQASVSFSYTFNLTRKGGRK